MCSVIRKSGSQSGSYAKGSHLGTLASCTRIVFLLESGDYLGEGLGAEVAFAAVADGDGAGFGFFCSDYQHVWNFLHLCVADLGGKFFVTVVEMDANIVALESFGDVLRVVGYLFAHRADFNLHWREPERECARVMFDEDAEETLNRAE